MEVGVERDGGGRRGLRGIERGREGEEEDG